jgi:hypothetical protein
MVDADDVVDAPGNSAEHAPAPHRLMPSGWDR